MSAPELLPKLPGDVQTLLAAERDLPELPQGVRQRLQGRLEVSVGILALGIGAATVGSATTSSTAAAAVGKVGLLGKPWLVAGIAFVLGGVAGAGVHALVRAPSTTTTAPVTTVVVERRIEVPVPAAVSSATTMAPSPTDLGGQPQGVAAPPPVAAIVTPTAQTGSTGTTAAKSATVTLGTDTGLAAERGLLEVARTALSRGDSGSALASLDDHVKRFPGGQLTEEREALYVQALARAGRLPEAKARAARFEKRFPGSMLLPVVEAATE